MTTIYKRYQYQGPAGIGWTKWYPYQECRTLEEAKISLKECKKEKNVDNLKSEFKIGHDVQL